ncbi:MAG: hypothetical protein J5I94_09590 [Phaeodactylibacter sp.]|nr:hypothetical protein [Phaeodactylibacter sp.]
MKIAIAVSRQNSIENQHFGDADKFLLYEVTGGRLELLGEKANPFKGGHGRNGHGHGHGERHGRKTVAVTRFFQEEGVEVLASKQFGPNIREVCRHFVPVLISEHDIEGAKARLEAHLPDLRQELGNHSGPHNILRIMEGDVLVIPLKKE